MKGRDKEHSRPHVQGQPPRQETAHMKESVTFSYFPQNKAPCEYSERGGVATLLSRAMIPIQRLAYAQ